ncbi:MAG: DUF116 domain-containing protein [Proteobacteria bacterium]|nr:DUF116 domain-containing protein [Pseudomonadota bacterium]
MSSHYHEWGFLVVSAIPFFVSILFLNLLLSVCCVLYTLFLVYPIIELTATLLKLDFDALRRDIIEYSNRYMIIGIEKRRGCLKSYEGAEVLLLLPHCLQNSDCLYKVTWDKLDNCRLCGKCSMPDIVEIKKKYGVSAVVVSGGTAAREIIKQRRPKCVLAVACENDLISGLREVRNIPVIAVLNQRLCGPCRDTTVDISVIKSYLDRLIK